MSPTHPHKHLKVIYNGDMQTTSQRLHPQELKRRLLLTLKEKRTEWLKTKEGKRQTKL